MPRSTVPIELAIEDAQIFRDLVMKELARDIQAIREAYEEAYLRTAYKEGQQTREQAIAKADTLVFELLGDPFASLKGRIDRAIEAVELPSARSEEEIALGHSQEEGESQATRW
jgi:hypothetical protein